MKAPSRCPDGPGRGALRVRVALWSAAILVLIGVTARAYLSERRTESRQVRMGLQVFSGLEPLVLAQQRGFYRANGADVHIQRFASLYDAKRAFATRKTDVTTMTVFDAILLAGEGVPFKVILVVDYTRGANAIVAQKGIATIRDLRGKRVGVTAGAALHSVLLAALYRNGMPETAVTVVNHPPDRLTELFLAGSLDAASLVEPFLTQVQREKKGRIIFGSQEIPRLVTDVLVMQPNLERTHPGAAAAIVSGYFQALQFWASDPKEAVALMAESAGLSPQEFEHALEGVSITGRVENEEFFGLGRPPGALREVIAEWDRILIANRYVRRPSDLGSRLDARYVRESLP